MVSGAVTVYAHLEDAMVGDILMAKCEASNVTYEDLMDHRGDPIRVSKYEVKRNVVGNTEYHRIGRIVDTYRNSRGDHYGAMRVVLDIVPSAYNAGTTTTSDMGVPAVTRALQQAVFVQVCMTTTDESVPPGTPVFKTTDFTKGRFRGDDCLHVSTNVTTAGDFVGVTADTVPAKAKMYRTAVAISGVVPVCLDNLNRPRSIGTGIHLTVTNNTVRLASDAARGSTNRIGTLVSSNLSSEDCYVVLANAEVIRGGEIELSASFGERVARLNGDSWAKDAKMGVDTDERLWKFAGDARKEFSHAANSDKFPEFVQKFREAHNNIEPGGVDLRSLFHNESVVMETLAVLCYGDANSILENGKRLAAGMDRNITTNTHTFSRQLAGLLNQRPPSLESIFKLTNYMYGEIIEIGATFNNPSEWFVLFYQIVTTYCYMVQSPSGAPDKALRLLGGMTMFVMHGLKGDGDANVSAGVLSIEVDGIPSMSGFPFKGLFEILSSGNTTSQNTNRINAIRSLLRGRFPNDTNINTMAISTSAQFSAGLSDTTSRSVKKASGASRSKRQ